MDMRANHELYSLLAHYNADYEHILKRITIRGPISVYDFTLIKAL